MLVNDLYEIVDKGEENMSQVRIIKGPYKGMLYQYGQVSFHPLEDGSDMCRMAFTYEIFDNPLSGKPDANTDEFKHTVGSILEEVLDMNAAMFASLNSIKNAPVIPDRDIDYNTQSL